MRHPSLAAVGLLVLLPLLQARAADSTWRTAPLPPDVAKLNRTADAAATTATAIQLYAQAIRLCPTNGPGLYGLGGALLDQGRPADSLKVFQRMDALFPDDPEIIVAIAAALARLPGLTRADLQDGIGRVEQALRLDPGNPEAWNQLSILRHLDGDYELAAEAARQAVAFDAQDPIDPETTARYQQQETACTDALLAFSPLD